MKPEDVVKELVKDPIKFLNAHNISLAGYTKAGGIVKDKYWITGEVGPEKKDLFRIMGQDKLDGAVKVAEAYSVPMFENKDVDFAKIKSTVLDDKGPPIMFTGQLTGCTFCWLKDGTKLHTAHIRPGGKFADGKALQTELMNKGRFEGSDKPIVAFGRREYGDDSAYVLGVRTGKEWKIYAQIRASANAGGALKKALQIS